MKAIYKNLLSIGVAIGVFCSLVVFTLGQTQLMAMELRNKILESGLYKIVNSPSPATIQYMGLPYARDVQRLLPDGVDSSVKAIAHVTVAYEDEPLPVGSVLGTDSKLAGLMEMQVLKGRFLSGEDVDQSRKVCVLKSNIDDLVKTRNATHLSINGDPYEIIGVVAGDEGSMYVWDGADILVPVTTLYKHIEKTSEHSGLIAQIPLDRGAFSKEELLDRMADQSGGMGIDISTLQLVPEQYNVFQGEEQFLRTLAAILALSLLVLVIASLNIIHIATASVMDRQREIGIRTAVGAKPRHILSEISAEILSCTVKGGIAGTAAASVFNSAANLGMGSFGLSFNLVSLAAGIFLSAAAGMITSVIPAMKAAKMDPAAALREE